jgi:hypothetical protein
MEVAVGKAAVRMRSVDGAKITPAPQIAGALKPRDIATARVGQMGSLDGGENVLRRVS